VAKSSAKKTGKSKTKSSPKAVVRKQAVKSKKPAPAPVVSKPVKTTKVDLKIEKPSKKSAAKPTKNSSEKPGSTGPEINNKKAPKAPLILGASQLKPKELEVFREQLIQKRHELLGDVDSMEKEALRSTSGSNLSNLPIHMADMGTDNYEQEFTLGLVEKDRQMLREINMALEKIKSGSYGICEGTGKPITRARLEAKPWARYSVEYMMKLEKGLVRR